MLMLLLMVRLFHNIGENIIMGGNADSTCKAWNIAFSVFDLTGWLEL